MLQSSGHNKVQFFNPPSLAVLKILQKIFSLLSVIILIGSDV